MKKPLLLTLCTIMLACGSGGRKSHYSWGVEHYDAGRYDEAAHEFALALEENPADALFNQGLSLVKAGRHGEAVDVLQSFLARFPGSAEGHINLAFALAGSGREQEAGNHFRQAIDLVPLYAWPYCAYARYLLDRNQPEADRKAMELLEIAVNLERQDTTAFYLHGLAAARLDQALQALEDQRKAVSLDSNNQTALVALGYLELDHQEYRSAARHFVDAVALDARDTRAWLGAGIAFRNTKQYELSMNALWNALALEPDNPEIKRELASTARALADSLED